MEEPHADPDELVSLNTSDDLQSTDNVGSADAKEEVKKAQKIPEQRKYGAEISFHGILKLYLLRLCEQGSDRIVELLLTFAIFSVAAVQLYTTITNNSSTNGQTEQLIAAAQISALSAKHNAAAAQSFATSAASINHGISDAVTNLRTEAYNIEAARESSIEESEKTLEATSSIARSESRAYLIAETSITSTTCQGGMYPVDCTNYSIINVGRTPAFFVQAEAHVKWDDPTGGSANISLPLKEMAATTAYSGIEGDTIGVGSDQKLPREAFGINRPNHCSQAYHGSECGHIVYGIIHYKDTFDNSHETGFCVYYTELPKHVAQFCRGGNWFDKRPENYPPIDKH